MNLDTLNHYIGIAQNVTFLPRAMFYLVTPNETYFEFTESVPHIPVKSMSVFFWFIVIENLITLAKHGKLAGSVTDSIASTSAGLLSLIPNFIFRGINIMAYVWIYENLRVFDAPWNSFWTYLVALLFVDFAYYWLHRAGHGRKKKMFVVYFGKLFSAKFISNRLN